MPYGVLSFSDFFCSIMSFWVTLLAMARLPLQLTSVGHMAGALALSMAVKWNTHGTLTNVLPVVIGCVIVIVSWVRVLLYINMIVIMIVWGRGPKLGQDYT